MKRLVTMHKFPMLQSERLKVSYMKLLQSFIDKARLGQKTIHKAFRLTQKEQRRKQIEEEAENYSKYNEYKGKLILISSYSMTTLEMYS